VLINLTIHYLFQILWNGNSDPVDPVLTGKIIPYIPASVFPLVCNEYFSGNLKYKGIFAM